MEEFFPLALLDLLIISIVTSVIIMTVIQKFKTLTIINKEWHIWLLNLILSFGIGIPFSVFFYNLTWIQGIWVGLFTFIGAPSIYETLKSQNIVNYKPTSLNDNNIKIDRE